MLATLGFLTIGIFLVLIMSRKVSVITALVIVPLVSGLISGASVDDLSRFMYDGLRQVAPTGILLVFAVLYFSVMLDAGLFDPVIAFIIRSVKGDPLKVVLGTAALTMVVHLDGDGTATFIIVISAFLPIYKKLGMSKLVLAGVVALAVGPLHLVPWSGTTARALATLNASPDQLFNPNLPAIGAGILWVLGVAFMFGRRERNRLGIISFDYQHHDSLTEEQKEFRRPRLIWVNALLTVAIIVTLVSGVVAAAVLFLIASALALLLNYPLLHDQQKVLKSHGANIFLVCSMVFAAGIFSGILSGTKMIEAMADTLVSLIPPERASLLPLITAITSMPSSLLFTPDAYYFGVVPVLSEAAQHYGIHPHEIGRAALLGQMTVGFPVSPLTASTFLLVGLCEVELGEHQRFIFVYAFGTTIVMTVTALLTNSIHL